VLGGFATLASSRIAAALLVVALSGVTGLVAPRARAAEPHCCCQGMVVDGHHICSCPICRLAAHRAGRRGRASPSSRRSEVIKALAKEAAPPPEEALYYSSRCDDSRSLPGVSPSTEPFTLPRVPVLPRRHTEEELGATLSAPASREIFPESPPPRIRES